MRLLSNFVLKNLSDVRLYQLSVKFKNRVPFYTSLKVFVDFIINFLVHCRGFWSLQNKLILPLRCLQAF